jgi:hypothetical protein
VIINKCWYANKVQFFAILKKFEFSQHIFKKYSNIKFHEIPSNCNRIVTCGRMGGETDGHKEANIRLS